MNVSRAYLLIGAMYLLVGMALGMFMGSHEDFTLAPVHAHINLLGFALMTIFGLAYRLLPHMADTLLARAHFWLHQSGALVFVAALYLKLSGTVTSGSVDAVLAASSGVVFLGMLCWAVNLFRNL